MKKGEKKLIRSPALTLYHHQQHQHLHKSVKNAELDPRVAVLSTVRGITPDMAKDLLEKFGSIPKILRTRTTQKEIMSVPGIGRKRAKDILKLRENY